MQTNGIIIKFDVTNDRAGSILEVEMPDIGHLNFEGSPKTLDRLIVVRSTGAGHTFPEIAGFYQSLHILRGILAASVTVKDRPSRAFRISSDSHPKRVHHQILGLIPTDHRTDDPPEGNVDHTA